MYMSDIADIEINVDAHLCPFLIRVDFNLIPKRNQLPVFVQNYGLRGPCEFSLRHIFRGSREILGGKSNQVQSIGGKGSEECSTQGEERRVSQWARRKAAVQSGFRVKGIVQRKLRSVESSVNQ
jgi:hypothetical protein